MRHVVRWLPAFCLLALAHPLFSQAAPASPAPISSRWRDQKVVLTGTVTDPSGSRLKGATLTFTGKYTSARTHTTTDRSGQYVILLELGVYTVGIAALHAPPWTTELTVGDTMMKNFVVGGPPSDGSPQPPPQSPPQPPH